MNKLGLILLTLPLLLFVACQQINTDSTSKKAIKVYLIGDSTCANKKKSAYPETGWGMKFGKHFGDSVRVVNYAVNGMSTKSFLNGGRWTEPIYEKLRPGD
ncbi:MAG: hypothetical protein ACK5IJ_07880 [Mangrovibacterium sp.]